MKEREDILMDILKETRSNACDKKYGYTIEEAMSKIADLFLPKNPLWSAKYVSFYKLEEELDAYSNQGYGIVKITQRSIGDFLIIAKRGYVGGLI